MLSKGSFASNFHAADKTIHVILKVAKMVHIEFVEEHFFGYQCRRKSSFVVQYACTIVHWTHMFMVNKFGDGNLPVGGRGWFHGSLWRLTTCKRWPEGAPRHQSAASFSSLRLVRQEKLSSQAMNSVRGFSPAVLADFAPGQPVYTTRCRSKALRSAAIVLPLTTKQCTHRTGSRVLLNFASSANKVRERIFICS